MKMKDIGLIPVVFLMMMPFLDGCATPADYRGVSAGQWQHLNAEQRQLIVEQSFEEDITKREDSVKAQ